MRWSLILAALTGLTAAAQQEYRLRVTVNLVQVDATVTDSKGDPVPDLKAGDFRVLLDGKPQELKYCNFVRSNDGAAPAPNQPPSAPSDPLAAPAAQPAMPAGTIKRQDVRRTIVLFVADLLTSSESIPGIRAGLKKFVLQQVHPGDLVAIVRSSAGLGALQDFTPDKSMLLAAVDQVHWTSHAVGIGGASAYEPIGQPSLDSIGTLDLAQLDKIDSIERATLATTTSLVQVVGAMADLPGRKSVILISDGLRLTSPDEKNPITGGSDTGTGAFLGPIYESMRRVADESVRAGVVVYAIDTRGLTSLRAGASDRFEGPPDTTDRRAEYSDNQWGGIYVAAQTGGFMITESNRIDAALERVMADQRGYYLLGFQPPADAMERHFAGSPDYHQLKIEVLRPGLKVRSHAGFFGIGDDEKTDPPSPELQLSNSVESPFQATDIHLDVESSFLMGKNSHYIRATVYIDGRDIVLKGPPIHRTGVLHLIVRAFNANGGSLPGGIDEVRRVDLNQDGFERAQQYGLIYTTLLPVSKPGAYRVRVACLDEASSKIGTGGDFVSIPPAKGNGLRLSGIVFQHDLGTDNHIVPASGPAVYSAGQIARFEFQIASGGPKSKGESLEMRTRLFRDGVEVWQSAAAPVEAGATKAAGAFARGSLEVPKGLDPGEYLVRVDVGPARGSPAGDKANPEAIGAWQWARLIVR